MKWKLGIIGVLITALLSVFVYHPLFQIKEISYQGNNFVSDEELIFYFKGLEGKSVLSSLAAVPLKKAFLNKYPGVSSVSCVPILPNKVVVTVEEKSPWVALVSESNTLFVADDGAILNPLSDPEQAPDLDTLLLIHKIPKEKIDNRVLSAALLTNIQKIVENLSFYFPLFKLQLEYLGEDNLILIKEDNLIVKLGSLEYLDVKIRNLNYFYKSEYFKEGRQDRYIDLRVEDRVVLGTTE